MMSGCSDVRDLLCAYLEGKLEEQRMLEVREHLAGCEDCTGILETLESIAEAGATLEALEPPDHLLADLASSPCTRWLGLLFQAVDREISQHNLERLLTHLEACPSCRRAWQDLTLVHQVSDAMEPSQYLLKRCIAARDRKPEVRPLLNRRMATAAAYFPLPTCWRSDSSSCSSASTGRTDSADSSRSTRLSARTPPSRSHTATASRGSSFT